MASPHKNFSKMSLRRMFGKAGSQTTGGRIKAPGSAGPSPHKPSSCPICGSTKTWRDGIRKTRQGHVQRYVCRSCGHRFSNPHKAKAPQTISSTLLKTLEAIKSPCQICAAQPTGAKNLAAAINENEKEKQAAGAIQKQTAADIKGKILEFAWWMKKQGYAESTVIGRTKLLRILVKRGANLLDPESVKDVIAKQTWSEGRKELAVEAYSSFLQMIGGNWNPPKYRRIEKLPFIPTEAEIDQLIAGCGKKMSAFLQLLKETAARAGEAWNLQWTDVDFVNKTIRILPEKGSSPRIFKVSSKLLAMLSMLPKTSTRVFGDYPLRGFARSFQRSRKLLAAKLGNPRLLQITFHTFRHWKATMEYHRTKDILYVMKLLGHKNIKNTLIYTQLVSFEDNEYICKAARNIEEATKLIEEGFEYVCDMESVKLFRKRK